MSFCTVPPSVAPRHPLLLGDDQVEGEEDGGGGVDGHRGGDPVERNLVEQAAHVGDGVDGDADPADLAAGHRVVGVEADLGGQVEGHGEAGGALLEQVAVAAVGLGGGRVAGVLAHGPQPLAVHLAIEAAGERVGAGVAELALVAVGLAGGGGVLRPVERRHRDLGPRGAGAVRVRRPLLGLRGVRGLDVRGHTGIIGAEAVRPGRGVRSGLGRAGGWGRWRAGWSGRGSTPRAGRGWRGWPGWVRGRGAAPGKGRSRGAPGRCAPRIRALELRSCVGPPAHLAPVLASHTSLPASGPTARERPHPFPGTAPRPATERPASGQGQPREGPGEEGWTPPFETAAARPGSSSNHRRTLSLSKGGGPDTGGGSGISGHLEKRDPRGHGRRGAGGEGRPGGPGRAHGQPDRRRRAVASPP